MFRYDPIPAILGFQGPALVITNLGDSLHDASRHMKALRPDFGYVELDWPGAHAIYDAPVLWAQAVAKYLNHPP